jgi:hypothetical protein
MVFGLFELAVSYGFVSLAINDGSLWFYLLTLIFFVGGLQNFTNLIGSLIHGRRQVSKAR